MATKGAANTPVDLTDPDNPEWTEADFARAKGPESLPPEILAVVPKTVVNKGGRPRAERPKVPVNLRLSAEVAEHLRESGAGWQTRVDAFLAKAIKAGRL